MTAKTEQVQIRVSPAEKAALKQRAAEAGLGMSAYVLARALPHRGDRFAELLQALEGVARSERSYVFAEESSGRDLAEFFDRWVYAKVQSWSEASGARSQCSRSWRSRPGRQ
ncbi:MAG: plasmid mobilization protein [Gemmatimonadota bacterium]